MRTRNNETPEHERLKREALRKVDEVAAAEAAGDELIRRNIKQHGP